MPAMPVLAFAASLPGLLSAAGPAGTPLNLPSPHSGPDTPVSSLPINAGSGDAVLPGTTFLHQLANGIGSWALVAAVIGIFVGAVLWAFGSYSQNYQQAYNGRRGVMVSGLAALLIGAGPYLIGFFFDQGQRVS